jgi:uncharacterized low-complexity protein
LLSVAAVAAATSSPATITFLPTGKGDNINTTATSSEGNFGRGRVCATESEDGDDSQADDDGSDLVKAVPFHVADAMCHTNWVSAAGGARVLRRHMYAGKAAPSMARYSRCVLLALPAHQAEEHIYIYDHCVLILHSQQCMLWFG